MSTRPNVLFICTDEWPGALLGCHGDSASQTPTIDFLARNGLDMRKAYSECPVCIPARRCLMTGLSPRSHGDRVYSDTMRMPDATTMARAFSQAGWQTVTVGKLHVYPQRDRIGFDDVSLLEEGRCEFGVSDDYEIWLGERGHAGQEFLHGMGNNTYYTRPWHLGDDEHETSWTTMEAMRQIARRDPTRPLFLYVSYCYPHPPLVPLQTFLDKHRDDVLSDPLTDDWPDEWVIRHFRDIASCYSRKEMEDARKAFLAQCTHIDYSIRMLIGSMREQGLIDNTIIVFMSDHGDMLFDHGMVAKRLFYEGSAHIPLIFSGRPVLKYTGMGLEDRLITIEDVMPTLMDICGLGDSVPEGIDGISLLRQERSHIYGEISEGALATRMVHDGRYKLIYYPAGNVFQLFDLEADPGESHDLARDHKHKSVLERLKRILADELYSDDVSWIRNGEFAGFAPPDTPSEPNFGLLNQRGLHWPQPPAGYAH